MLPISSQGRSIGADLGQSLIKLREGLLDRQQRPKVQF